jgi:hypothetical protein
MDSGWNSSSAGELRIRSLHQESSLLVLTGGGQDHGVGIKLIRWKPLMLCRTFFVGCYDGGSQDPGTELTQKATCCAAMVRRVAGAWSSFVRKW